MNLPFVIMLPDVSFKEKDVIISFSTAPRINEEKYYAVVDWWSLTDKKGHHAKREPQGISACMSKEQYGKRFTLRMKNIIDTIRFDQVEICIHFLIRNGTSASVIYTYQKGSNRVLFKAIEVSDITEQENVKLEDLITHAATLEKYIEEDYIRKQSQKNEEDTSSKAFNEDLSNYMDAVFKEMLFLKNNGGRKYKVTNGMMIEHFHGMYIYSFDLEAELFIADDSPVTLTVGIKQVPGVALMCENFKIIIAFEEILIFDKDAKISSAEISIEPWKLLERLNTRLRSISNANKIALKLMNEGPKLSSSDNSKVIARGQQSAFKHALENPITVIWGPPGTGKTYTMAKIARKFLSQHKKVLIVSHSNVSVDNVAKQIHEVLKDTQLSILLEKSKVLRYGYIRDEELQKNDCVSSFNAAIKNSKDKDEYDRLQDEYNRLREEVDISTNKDIELKLFNLHERIKTIRAKHKSEERNLVSKAYLVATTVSKIYADALFENKQYDVVMFDEISMAYIPQIICASSFAKEHLICVGDFRQLSPIVQDEKAKKILGKDLFEYLNISNGLTNINYHPWLVMLNKQRRMHPDIALFPSSYIYNHLLKNDESVLTNRNEIVNSRPFSTNPMTLIDTYGTTAFGNKNEDNSRFNILSAVISLGTAIESEKSQSNITDISDEAKVGIITPYAAQTRLIKAMIQDYRHNKKTHISCATVHQFQGSERNVVIFDAVENYPATRAGWLMSKNENGAVTRLVNVAVTRARGKFIAIANKTFWLDKFGPNNMFCSLVKHLKNKCKVLDYTNGDLLNYVSSLNYGSGIKVFTDEHNCKSDLLNDIKAAKQKVVLLIPKGRMNEDYGKFVLDEILKLRFKTLSVNIIYDKSVVLPSEYDKISIPSDKVTMPLLFIDNKVWYGLPIYNYHCGDKNNSIPVLAKMIVKFTGKYTVDMIKSSVDYSTIQQQMSPCFKEYLKDTYRCMKCDGAVDIVSGDAHYLKCKNCWNLRPLTVDMINEYLSATDARCPICGRDQEARSGRFGIYMICEKNHTFNIDKI